MSDSAPQPPAHRVTDVIVLGDDPAVLPLLQVIVEDERYHILAAVDADEMSEAVARIAPNAELLEEWESLAERIRPGSVAIVAADEPRLWLAGRGLALKGADLILFPRFEQNSALLYELSLLRDAEGVLLFCPWRHEIDPQVDALHDALRGRTPSEVLHVEVQRTAVPERGTLLTARQIKRELFFDVALLRHLFGEYDEVTALFTGDESRGFSRATVTLAAPGLPEAILTVAAQSPHETAGGSRAVLTIETAQASRVLHASEEGFWYQAASDPAALSMLAGMFAGRWWDRFLRLRGEAPLTSEPEPAHDPLADVDRWTDRIRCQETVEITERSRKRRRAVTLHFESVSERSQFKTQMTAVGCGVFVLTLCAIPAVLVIGTLFDLPRPWMLALGILTIVPMLLFLAAQAFLLITRPSITEQEPTTLRQPTPEGSSP